MKYLNTCLRGILLCAILVSFIAGCGEDEETPTGPINYAPNTPYSPTPGDGWMNRPVESELYWRGGDPNVGDVVTYDLYFDALETPPLLAEDLTDTTFNLGTLEPMTTYYWKVIAFDRLGESAAGPVWNFTTEAGPNIPPNAPANPSPADGAVDQPLFLNLSWICSDPDADDTLAYYVYFDTSVPPQTVSPRLTEAIYDPGALEPETEYFWKVVAYDNYGDSTVGPVWDFTTGAAAEGIFGAFAVVRMIMYVEDQLFRFDEIVARFDSEYAPCDPISPLEADGVTCNEFMLDWDPALSLHKYPDTPVQPFISLSGEYIFNVEASSQVPLLIDTIDFPASEPYITNPENDDTLSISGFSVTWSGAGVGDVRFILMTGDDSTGVTVETDNDGSYTFTGTDLEPLGGQAGEYMIMMIHQNSEAIAAAGYDSRSFIWARVINIVSIYLE
ncbi:MAG: hypothetical protein GY839_15685 [candidate division Zixibacteria bacterium]|nr:hypothetical protein [candidate division Zixibacteria bacterium]